MSDKYGTGQDGQYCYPDSDVLINKLGLTNGETLEAVEVELTQARIDQYEPDFDDISLSALRATHFYLFQDLRQAQWHRSRTVAGRFGRTSNCPNSRIDWCCPSKTLHWPRRQWKAGRRYSRLNYHHKRFRYPTR